MVPSFSSIRGWPGLAAEIDHAIETYIEHAAALTVIIVIHCAAVTWVLG